jgi:hypothetical protein
VMNSRRLYVAKGAAQCRRLLDAGDADESGDRLVAP